MKIKSYFLQIGLVFVLLIAFLAGCGRNSESASNTSSTSNTNSLDDILGDSFVGFYDSVDDVVLPEIESIDLDIQTESLTEIINGLFGSVSAGIYTNDTLSIGCKIGDDWTYYTEEEIMELNQTTLEILSDPDVAMVDPDDVETLNFIDMYASSADASANVNVGITRLSVIEAYTLTEEEIVAASLEQSISSYETMGFSDCVGAVEVCSFLGKEYPAMKMEATLYDTPIYLTQVYIKEGRNFGVISVSCFGNDITDEILSWFYTID